MEILNTVTVVALVSLIVVGILKILDNERKENNDKQGKNR